MNRYMEGHLGMPLGDVLQVIQDRALKQSTYFGVKTLKSPLDFWVYREMIFLMRPDVIVEVGNYHGGSALALAHILDHVDNGRVIGVDITHEAVPRHVLAHPRITFIEGDACERLPHIESLIKENESVLVIEDSSHTYENTLAVIRAYSRLIRHGGYMIVEDGICWHGLSMGPRPGPYEAIETFINESVDFEIDRSKESFLITWNPKGYLRRISR